MMNFYQKCTHTHSYIFGRNLSFTFEDLIINLEVSTQDKSYKILRAKSSNPCWGWQTILLKIAPIKI